METRFLYNLTKIDYHNMLQINQIFLIQITRIQPPLGSCRMKRLNACDPSIVRQQHDEATLESFVHPLQSNSFDEKGIRLDVNCDGLRRQRAQRSRP